MTKNELYLFLRDTGMDMRRANRIAETTPKSSRMKVAMKETGRSKAEVEAWLKQHVEKWDGRRF